MGCVLALAAGVLGVWTAFWSQRDELPRVRGDRTAAWFAMLLNGIAVTLMGLGLAAVALGEKLLDNIHIGSKGRRMRVNDRPRVAEVVREEAWTGDETPDVSDLTWAERAALSEVWLRTAQLEHASVPAFSDLSMRLVAMGAPPELVARSHHAALDEIEHARRCFALVAGYSGTPRSPGPMPILLQRSADASKSRLALGSLLDGALGEGVAAEMARVAAESATDVFAKRTLEIIARDEAKHAALAWDIVVWCFETGDADVQRALREGLGRLREASVPSMPAVAGVRAEKLIAHGYVANEVLARLHEESVRCLEARLRELLGDDVALAA
jgi:hypothetical protein